MICTVMTVLELNYPCSVRECDKLMPEAYSEYRIFSLELAYKLGPGTLSGDPGPSERMIPSGFIPSTSLAGVV